MRYLKGLAILIGLNAQLAIAELPHSFEAGTPAKASEVNDNFSYLLDRIESLEQQSESFECPELPSDFPYVYEYEALPLGTSIYVGDSEYRITKIRVIDPVTLQRFDITSPQPVRTTSGEEPISYVNFYFYTYFIAENERYICDGSSIFGDGTLMYNKPTGFGNPSYRYKGFSNGGGNSSTNDKNYGRVLETDNLSASFHAAFGSQYITISLSSRLFTTEVSVDNGDYDFTDNIPVPPEINRTVLAEEMTRYFNNIRIEEVR